MCLEEHFLSWDIQVAFIVVMCEGLGGRHNCQTPSLSVGEGEALFLSKITPTLASSPLFFCTYWLYYLLCNY